MIDLFEIARDRVREWYPRTFLKRFDVQTGKDGVCIRPVQGTTVKQYFDGSREITQPYQVIVRDRSELKAMQVCQDIADRLMRERLESANGSYTFLAPMVYAEPQELQLDEKNLYAWVVTMAAHIQTNGE